MISRLFAHREIIHDCEGKFNALVKRIERDTFVIAVEARKIILAEREGKQAVGLHIAQAQRGRVRVARRHEWNDGDARIGFGRNAGDGVVEIGSERGGRSGFGQGQLGLEVYGRIVYKLLEFGKQWSKLVSREQADVDYTARFRGNHIRTNSSLQDGGRNSIAQHSVPQRAIIRDHLGGVFAAVGGVERAYPLAGFLVLQRSDGLKISARYGIKL